MPKHAQHSEHGYRSFSRLIVRSALAGVCAALLLAAIHTFTARVFGQDDQASAPLSGELAYVIDGDIWLEDLATGEKTLLVEDGSAAFPVWSPDGRYLAYDRFALGSGEHWRLDLATGDNSLVAREACCGAWHPETQEYYLYRFDTRSIEVQAVNAQTFQRYTLAEFEHEDYYPDVGLLWARLDDDWTLTAVFAEVTPSVVGTRSVPNLYQFKPGESPAQISVLGGHEFCEVEAFAAHPALSLMAVEYMYDSCATYETDFRRKVAVFEPDTDNVATYFDAGNPAFSHDGRFLAVNQVQTSNHPWFKDLNGVHIIDLATRDGRHTIDAAYHPAWRPTASDSEVPTEQPAMEPEPEELPSSAGDTRAEFAYVKDGDIWLHDLTTGTDTRLIIDGDAAWPVWSPDGRYLAYSRETARELRLFDLAAQSTRVLAEEACCAGWSPDGSELAVYFFVDHSIQTVSVGDTMATLIGKAIVARGTQPLGPLRWFVQDGDPKIVIPTATLIGAGGDWGMAWQLRNIDYSSEFEGRILQYLEPVEDCGVTGFDRSAAGDMWAIASVEGDCENETDLAQAIVLQQRGLPTKSFGGLLYPALAADGQTMLAERALAAEQLRPEQVMASSGIVLVDIVTDEVTDLLADGQHPAWRPAASAALLDFVQTGERLVTLSTPFLLDGNTYRFHYTTFSDFANEQPALLRAANQDGLADRGITAILVTRNGELLDNPKEILRVLRIFAAGHALEEELAAVAQGIPRAEVESLYLAVTGEELPAALSRRATVEAVRALLTNPAGLSARAGAQFGPVLRSDPDNLLHALNTLRAQVAPYDRDTLELSDGLAALVNLLNVQTPDALAQPVTAEFVFDYLQLLRVLDTRLQAFIAYRSALPTGRGSLSGDPITVLPQVQIETGDVRRRAGQLVLDLLGDRAFVAGFDKAAAPPTDAPAWSTGSALADHLIVAARGRLISSLDAAALYSLDDIPLLLEAAIAAEELRVQFEAGRKRLQAEALRSESGAGEGADGELIVQITAAHLLERAAGAAALRLYLSALELLLQAQPELSPAFSPAEAHEIVDDDITLALATESRIFEQLSHPAVAEEAWALCMERLASPQPNPWVQFVNPPYGMFPDDTEIVAALETPTPTNTPAPTAVPTATPTATPIPPPPTILGRQANLRVITTQLNLRSGPGTNYTVLGQAGMNQYFLVMGCNLPRDWIEVCCINGLRAWMYYDPSWVHLTIDIRTVPVVLPYRPPSHVVINTCSGAVDGSFGNLGGRNVGCALSSSQIIWAAWQPFERGHMIWRSDTDDVYYFINGAEWGVSGERWHEGVPIRSRGTAPGGLVAPIRGFGRAWGESDMLFEQLGWGTDAEKGFCARVQDYQHGFALQPVSVSSCKDNLYNHATAPDFTLRQIVATSSGAWYR